jgi:hypothetical protein
MSSSLTDALNELHADPDTVQQGLRLFMSEQTNDLTPTEMLAEMKSKARDPEELEQLLARLREDNAAINQAALASLEAAWSDPSARPSIQASLRHAKDKLPVIELGILAIVAMYAMYRCIPAQPTKTTTTIAAGKDGNYTQTTTVEHEPFLPIVSAFGRLFTRTDGGEGSGTPSKGKG